MLFAESYEGVRRSCVRYLDRFNFQVTEVSHGDQAVARIAADPPQVILTELNLPAMPARRLAQWLSQSWRTRQIPVIVLVADLDPASYEDVRPLVAGLLVKPFSLAKMLEEIRRVLRATQSRS